MNHNEYIKKCHELAKENGWWDDLPGKSCKDCFDGYRENDCICNDSIQKRNEWLADKIDLIAGEGAEAIEALRNGRRADRDKLEQWRRDEERVYRRDGKRPNWFRGDFEQYIKDTLEDEITDIYIRTCDLMGFYGKSYVKCGYLMDSTKYCLREIRLAAINFATLVCSYGSRPGSTFSYILTLCLKIAEIEGFNLEEHVKMKLEYNSTRGRKHGKEF